MPAASLVVARASSYGALSSFVSTQVFCSPSAIVPEQSTDAPARW